MCIESSTHPTRTVTARALAAGALLLGCSCARDARPAPIVVTETPDVTLATEVTGVSLAPASFERAPGDLGLDFVHAGGHDSDTPAGPGIVLFDANSDARLDVYLTQGAPTAGGGSGPVGRLYIMEQERFVDRTADAGLALDSLRGRALGARAVDYDGDGDWDLLLSYEGQERLMRNEGGRFTDVSDDAGRARALLIELDGPSEVGAGIDESTAGRASAQFTRVSFDANLDGHSDLLTLDGGLTPAPPTGGASELGPQRPRLYLGTGARSEYVDTSASSGPVFDTPIAGRGLALGDIDGDLDVDVIVIEHGGPAQVWLDQNPSGHRPLRLVLISQPPNTYALGAEVTATGGTAGAVRRVHLGSRYLSQNEHTLTFGFGAEKTTEVTVRWPDGRTTEHRDLAPGPTYVLH